MKIVVVSGSVASGKTKVSKLITKILNADYLDVNDIIKKYDLDSGYDKRRKCVIVDVDKLNEILIKIIEDYSKKDKSLVIDSHLAHFIPAKYVDVVVITKCNLKELKKRLEKRNYSKDKIKENLDVEIFDSCYNEAIEAGHKVKVIDTTKDINLESINKLFLA